MRAAALIIAAVGVLWALLATLVLAPSFTSMFEDFAATLPWLTRLMVTPWGPLAIAFASVAGVAASTLARPKWLPLVLAVVGTLAQPAVFLVAMYLPIFTLAGQVQ